MLTCLEDYAFTATTIVRTGKLLKHKQYEVLPAKKVTMENGISFSVPAQMDIPNKLNPLFDECKGTESFSDLAYFFGVFHAYGAFVDQDLLLILPPETDIDEFIKSMQFWFKKYLGSEPIVYKDEISKDTQPLISVPDIRRALSDLGFNMYTVPDVVMSLDHDSTLAYIYPLLMRCVETEEGYVFETPHPHIKMVQEVAMLLSKLGIPYRFDEMSFILSKKVYKTILEQPDRVVIKRASPMNVKSIQECGMKVFIDVPDCVGINGFCLEESA